MINLSTEKKAIEPCHHWLVWLLPPGVLPWWEQVGEVAAPAPGFCTRQHSRFPDADA